MLRQSQWQFFVISGTVIKEGVVAAFVDAMMNFGKVLFLLASGSLTE